MDQHYLVHIKLILFISFICYSETVTATLMCTINDFILFNTSVKLSLKSRILGPHFKLCIAMLNRMSLHHYYLGIQLSVNYAVWNRAIYLTGCTCSCEMNGGTAQHNPLYEIVLIVFFYWRWHNSKIFQPVALALMDLCRSTCYEE